VTELPRSRWRPGTREQRRRRLRVLFAQSAS
jgi:hypothetical protein